jgi:very-short-patch-repair endonuclease
MISPRMIIKGSNYKYWFKCNNCNHEFNSRLSDVSNGTWCPYCCFPIRKLCEDDDCKQCFENSFASHINSIHWHPMNMISPRMITKSSGNKYWFKCDNCIHIFYSSLGHVSNGTWCPYCVNKTEGILLEYLKKYENVISQFKVEWCKNKSYLPFDFCLPEFKLIIELDGRQHFRQVSNWTSPEECHKTDCYKMKQALVNGYSVIRLLQIDVFYNTYDWKMELTENIEKIKKENTPQVIFMGGEEEYENMRKEMN